MELRKTPKTDLVAIYRLEFYKKQKCWKLSTDAKKNKRDKNSKAKNQLNKTYDVVAPKTNSCQLNDAFLDSDHEKSNTVISSQLNKQNVSALTRCSPYKFRRTNAWHDNEQKQNEPAIEVHTKQRFSKTESHFPRDNMTCVQAERDCLDFNGGLEYNNRWTDNDNPIDVLEFGELWGDDLSRNIKEQHCGDNAANMLCTLEDFLQDDMWLPDDENLLWIHENLNSSIEDDGWCDGSEQSIDSWGDFMRGADVAPHSSEIELSVPNNISVSSVAFLSSAQLNAAVRSHTRLLRSLLKEERLRRRNRSRLSLTSGTPRPFSSPRPAFVHNNYERPTHDYEPSAYHTPVNTLQRERTFTKTFEDVFVAGSHTNGDLELLGRGRGRLQCATGDDVRRIVGVGRGRPVRL